MDIRHVTRSFQHKILISLQCHPQCLSFALDLTPLIFANSSNSSKIITSRLENIQRLKELITLVISFLEAKRNFPDASILTRL